MEIANLSYGFTVPFAVTIADLGPPHDLAVSIDTDPGLISADVAARLVSVLETLVLRGLEDPDCPLTSLPIMGRGPGGDFGARSRRNHRLPEHATLAMLCSAQAERTPNATALRFGEEEWSYLTLHQRATCLARRLSATGVRPGVVVGIALPREPSLVAAVLAVHKAGGAYLGLDPSYPAERICFMIADAAAPLIVTNATLAALFAEFIRAILSLISRQVLAAGPRIRSGLPASLPSGARREDAFDPAVPPAVHSNFSKLQTGLVSPSPCSRTPSALIWNAPLALSGGFFF